MSASRALMLVMEAFMETKQDRTVRISKEALEADPNCKLARYLLGMVYAGRGLYPLAIEQYREIVTHVDPEDPGIWFLLARQYHMADQLDEAVEHYKKAYELDPLCDKACLYISQIYCDRGEKLDEALQYAQKAIELRSPECMVDEETFLANLKRARQLAQQSRERGDGDVAQEAMESGAAATEPNLANAAVARLVEMHPHLVAVFTKHGIRCVGCSGYYEDETVRQAAVANGADVQMLVDELAEAITTLPRTGVPAGDLGEVNTPLPPGAVSLASLASKPGGSPPNKRSVKNLFRGLR